MKTSFIFPKHWVIAFLAVFLGAGCAQSQPKAQKNETFRVMTFNIHHAVGLDEKLDLQRIADLIKSEKADLVALQEVDKGIERSNKLDLGAALGRMTGMSCVFSNNYSYSGGEYGNAILSRFKVVSRDHRLIPKTDTPEQRGWLKAVVEVHGRKLAFWNTHIDHRRDDAERLQGVEKFVAWKKEEPLPVIFCGDFNDTPGSRTHRKLKVHFDDTWEKVGQGPGHTVPVTGPTRRIDYIWVSHGAEIEPIRAWVPVTDASDHLPVVAEFRWKK